MAYPLIVIRSNFCSFVHTLDIGLSVAGKRVNPQNEAKVALLLLSPVRIPEAAIDNLGARGIHLLIGDYLPLVVRRDAVIKDVLPTGPIDLPWFPLYLSQFRRKQ